MRRWGLLACACVLVGVAAACGSKAGAGAGRPEPEPQVGVYVALGDSYTSGAGMPEEVPGSACIQSELAYPRLVARELGAELSDGSCGGATTDNLTVPQPQQTGAVWPPQLEAVRPDADLVTVSLGFNDEGFFGRLLGCSGVGPNDPTGHPCRTADPELADVPQRTGDRVAAVLEAVAKAAPEARLVVVGYPQLVPAIGECPQLGLAEGDLLWERDIIKDLDEQLREVAEDAGATYVDVMGASIGHDVCAGEDAWLSGVGGTPDQRAPLHPRPLGHQQVAELVLEALGR